MRELALVSKQPGSYGSRQFRQRLLRYRMRQNMSRRGNCHDNSPMECVFRSLKTEWIPTVGYMTAQEVYRDIRSLSDASVQLDPATPIQRWAGTSSG